MKKIKYFFEAIFIYFLFFIIKIVGLNLGRKISSFLFLLIGNAIKSKKITEKNISIAFSDSSKIRKASIIKSMWSNYGKTFAEYLFLDKFRYDKFQEKQINILGIEKINKIVSSNRPVIFISGHFANFELMAMELTKKNIKLAAIYRRLNNFFLNPFMTHLRRKYICENQIEKGLKGTSDAIKFLKKNYSIALMVDQRLGQSERYPFFNVPAHTTTLPAQLAIKFSCDIVPIYLERKENDFFNMEILDPIKINKSNNPENEKKDITLKINQIIENFIIRNPGQWIWTHNRWK